jgi:hypothetical protein
MAPKQNKQAAKGATAKARAGETSPDKKTKKGGKTKTPKSSVIVTDEPSSTTSKVRGTTTLEL